MFWKSRKKLERSILTGALTFQIFKFYEFLNFQTVVWEIINKFWGWTSLACLPAALDTFSPRRIFHSATLWRENLILKRCDRWRELLCQKNKKMCLLLPPVRFLTRPRQDVTHVEPHHLGPRKSGLVIRKARDEAMNFVLAKPKNSKIDGWKSGKAARAVLDFGCRTQIN